MNFKLADMFTVLITGGSILLLSLSTINSTVIMQSVIIYGLVMFGTSWYIWRRYGFKRVVVHNALAAILVVVIYLLLVAFGV